MTFTQIFEELCPTYMAYGMTYDEYWHGDPWMVRAYVQAYILRRKIENENAWIQGAYMANAFATVLGNTFGKRRMKYLEKPMDLFPKTEAEKQAEIREERRKVIAWLNGMKRAAERKEKKNTGSDQNAKP